MHTFNWLVKIFNGSGSDAVNIQDGGNSITVDGTVVPGAGTAAIGTVGNYEESGVVYIGTTAYTVKYAYLDTASSGNQQIVAAVSSKKIRVLTYLLSVNAAVNLYFRSSTAGQISNTHYLAANGGATGAYTPHGHFETTAGEALQINLSAAVNIGSRVSYIEV